MFGFLRRRKPTFIRDNKEVFLRAWWFASFVALDSATLQREFEDFVGITPLRESGMFDASRDRQSFSELLAYVSCCALSELRDNIEAIHGWTDETYDLHIGYLVSVGMAFDEFFDIPRQSADGFVPLIQNYYSPNYSDDYEEFWDEHGEDDDDDLEEVISNSLSAEDSDHDNTARYYAFRIGQLFEKVDPQTIIRNAEPYRAKALRRSNMAFKVLSLAQIENDLRSLHCEDKG